MNKELSDAVFQSRLTNLPGNILTYVDYKEKSEVDVILLHEHLGLQNYVRVIGQALINNQHSIIFPNLFGQSEDDDEEEDTVEYLEKLSQKKIAETALSVINYVAKRGKKIVLMGFSIGAAIGLKVLEYTNKVDFGFFFYGLPPLETIRPQRITANVTIFLGSDDKVKYLSDRTIARRVGSLYHKNKKIDIMDLEGGRHGFVNAACDAYDQTLFEVCCDRVHEKIGSFSKNVTFSVSEGSRKNEGKEKDSRKTKNKSEGKKQRANGEKENQLKKETKEELPSSSKEQKSNIKKSPREKEKKEESEEQIPEKKTERKTEKKEKKKSAREDDDSGCFLM